VIEVFADVVCPFTYVGLERLRAHRDRVGRDDVALFVRSWPLELVNGEPVPRDLLVEEITELRATVAPLMFRGVDPERFPMTSLPALALAASAYRDGLRTGEWVSVAMREALFERGRDLTDPAELARIGRVAGLEPPHDRDYAAVRADLDEGRRRSVIGSPHFFVDGRGYFCPSLDLEREDGRLRIHFDVEGFDEFVRDCFA
jgi:predicted DsbA family dithiol-disulfide isomerase